MQLHHLKRNNENYKPARVGRGGKRGKTSGRGTKGQLARAGRKLRPELRDIIKKIPKLRGRGKNFLKSVVAPTIAINLNVIEKNFSSGDVVSKKTLDNKKLFRVAKSKNWNYKILSLGDITKKITVQGIPCSSVAKQKIEKAGGSIAM